MLTLALALILSAPFDQARQNGVRFDEALTRMDRVMRAWLKEADPRTLLLPDRLPGGFRGLKPGDTTRQYTPHNSGADLYPYLILTAHLTDPEVYRGRMMEMLRNEVRFTNAAGSVPGNLDLVTGKLGPASLFGAGEYAKDGLVSVSEYLGRTPWYYRMVDMVADAMERAPVPSRFGLLPASDAELNGDFLQVLARLARMTGDPKYLEWGRRIARAYIEEVLAGNNGVPASNWDFEQHKGDGKLRLRDHGNEMVVGLCLMYASDPNPEWRAPIARMLDRILASANPDGLLYNQVDAATLEPLDRKLSDNWGYVYGAVYAFYQATGETKYRDAVVRVLRNLPKYRNYDWEGGSFDGYADSIEGAIYLAAREPVPEALDWIESEIRVMEAKQLPSGLVEHWYGEGNFNRTLMLYALMKSQGVRPERWQKGVRYGAVREGDRLRLTIEAPAGWQGRTRFDFARHRRVMNLEKNYVRLNEFPEWYAVDENTLYQVNGRVLLGSELIEGVMLEPGEWIIEPLKKAVSNVQ